MDGAAGCLDAGLFIFDVNDLAASEVIGPATFESVDELGASVDDFEGTFEEDDGDWAGGRPSLGLSIGFMPSAI